MKVFISQPMMNRSNEILMRERSKVKQELISEGHEVVDSLFTLPEGKNTPLHYLAKSIELIAECDGVVFMKDWDLSRGCVMEHEIALQYNKFVKIL